MNLLKMWTVRTVLNSVRPAFHCCHFRHAQNSANKQQGSIEFEIQGVEMRNPDYWNLEARGHKSLKSRIQKAGIQHPRRR